MSDNPNEKKTDVVTEFVIESRINDRRHIVARTYVSRDADPEVINGVLDKLCNAADRQDNRYRLKDLNLLLEKQTQELPMHVQKLADYEVACEVQHKERNRKGDFEWAGQFKTNRDNLKMTIKGCQDQIERTKAAIVECQELIKV